MGIDGLAVQQISLLVEAHQLAARAETGIQGHDAFLSEGRGQQELTQVPAEDPDGIGIGLFLRKFYELVFK